MAIVPCTPDIPARSDQAEKHRKYVKRWHVDRKRGVSRALVDASTVREHIGALVDEGTHRGGDAGDDGRIPCWVEGVGALVAPDVGAVVGDEDRDVADEPDSPGRRLLPEGGVLAEEALALFDRPN